MPGDARWEKVEQIRLGLCPARSRADVLGNSSPIVARCLETVGDRPEATWLVNAQTVEAGGLVPGKQLSISPLSALQETISGAQMAHPRPPSEGTIRELGSIGLRCGVRGDLYPAVPTNCQRWALSVQVNSPAPVDHQSPLSPHLRFTATTGMQHSRIPGRSV